MKTLGYEEMIKAKDAVRILYQVGLIDMFIYKELIAKIKRNTGQ